MSNDNREVPMDKLERALAEAKEILNSDYASDIDHSYCLLEELRLLRAELERRLESPERANQ